MPSSAKLTDKLVMILQQMRRSTDSRFLRLSSFTQRRFKCRRPWANAACLLPKRPAALEPEKGMGLFCSLPDDRGQFFKSVLIIGTAPNAIAIQTVPAVEAVFKSYKIAPGWAQKMFSPVTPPAPAAPQPGLGGPDETQIVLRAMANNQRAMDIGFACADANIIGNGSNWQTPRECGGYAPNP